MSFPEAPDLPGSMSADEKVKALQKYIKDRLGPYIKKLEDASGRKTLEQELDGKGGLTDITTAIAERSKEARQALKELSAEGMSFAKGGPLATALGDTTTEIDLLLGSAKAGARTFKGLSKSLSGFAQMNEATLKGSRSLSSELATQAAVLGKLGVSLGSFSKNVDLAIYSFNLASDGVKNLNMDLKNLADDVKMLPETVSRNFQSVAQNLAYDFGMIKEQFVKMQKLSAETGVSMDTLAGKFGKPLDTISGASGFAAQINSLLGKNVFSTTELLMMDDATRMEETRKRLMKDGRITASLAAGGAERKFALQSISAALGMGIDDTRRFIETGKTEGTDESVKSKIGKQMDLDFAKQSDKFKEGLTDLALEMDNTVKRIRRTQLSMENQIFITARERQLREATTRSKIGARVRSLQAMQGLENYGPMGAGLSTQELMKAMADPSSAGQLEELVELYQIFRGTGGVNEKLEEKVAKIVSGLGSDVASERADARSAMQEILSDTSRQLAGDRTMLQPAILSAANKIPAAGGQRRRFLNFVLKEFADDQAKITTEALNSGDVRKRFMEAEKARAKEIGTETGPEYQKPRGNTDPSVGFNAQTKSVANPAPDGNVVIVNIGSQSILKLINDVVDGKINTKVEELTPKR